MCELLKLSLTIISYDFGFSNWIISSLLISLFLFFTLFLYIEISKFGRSIYPQSFNILFKFGLLVYINWEIIKPQTYFHKDMVYPFASQHFYQKSMTWSLVDTNWCSSSHLYHILGECLKTDILVDVCRNKSLHRLLEHTSSSLHKNAIHTDLLLVPQ